MYLKNYGRTFPQNILKHGMIKEEIWINFEELFAKCLN